MNKILGFLAFILCSGFHSSSFAVNYAGIWQDSNEQFYSINQSDNGNLVLISLASQDAKLAPQIQGHIDIGHSATDLAINGQGFFALQDTHGQIFFTRHGQFFVNKQGYLVDPNGYRLLTKENFTLVANRSANTMRQEQSNCIPQFIDIAGTSSLCEPLSEQLEISTEGAISVNLATEKAIIDQVLIADIYPSDLKPSGSYYVSKNPSRVIYQTAGDNRQVISHALEMREYQEKHWAAYTGLLNNREAIIEDSQSGSQKHIEFTNSQSAILQATHCMAGDKKSIQIGCKLRPALALSKVY